MIRKENVEVTEIKTTYVSISCDVCKVVYLLGDESVRPQIESFIHIRKQFGYGSLNDGDTYRADICNECAEKLFKNIWRLEDGN
jgi:hypothetical protein